MNQAKFMEQQTQHLVEVGYKAVLTQTKNKWRSAVSISFGTYTDNEV